MALVVKVKYNTSLRRFNVFPMEDGSLDLSLAGLRSKICELFQFNPSAQFVITYVDEDNDIVTMADNNDLLDVLNQGLNPLRLEVSLMGQNNRATEKQSQSQPSTPRDFSIPKEQGKAFDLRSICSDETLKLLPEPLSKAILKCTKETTNLASTTAVAELIEGVIKLVSTHLGPLIERQQTGGAGGGAQPNSTVAFVNASAEQGTGNAQPSSGDRFVPSPLPPVGHAHGFGLKENHGFGENMHGTFHRGVQCDGCGMHPIIGPRYKSLVRDDYDLCQSCFSDVGNKEEYMKLDRALYRPPALYRSPHKDRSFHGRRHFHKSPVFYPPPKCPAFAPPPGCNLWNSPTSIYCPQGPSAGKSANKTSGKLDCRFVQDVTIFDGTQFAPGTPFTKIWRLRNNGTLKWPHQTQLVRVGGDDLGAGDVVNLEIQEEGYAVDEELDAAIDFLAPIQPGRYVSYWRLMAPSGQKFGQRVWVLIQVVPAREKNLPDLMDSLLTLNEVEQNNLSQEQIKQKTADVSSQDTSERPCLGDSKMDLDPNELGCSSMVADKGKQPSSLVEVGNAFTQSQRVDFPTEMQGASSINVEVTPSDLGAGYPSPAKPVPLPVNDVSRGHIAVSASAPSLVGSESFFAGKETEEQTLLRELEDMGFNQRMLNAELLRKHNYDLQKTLDDLCSAAEWDPILEELQEMGFHDSEMNRTLLVKNDGSVKRVVLDLLSAEKDASSMQFNLSKKAKQS